MIRIFLIYILIVSRGCLWAQHDSSAITSTKNSLFIEIGGNGVEHGINFNRPQTCFSINYDRIIRVKSKTKTTLRVGTNIPTKNNLYIFNIMFNELFGRKKIYFETGIGTAVVFGYADKSRPYFTLTTVLGLRFQHDQKGIIARIGITPTIGVFPGEIYIGPLAGFSIGYTF